MGNNIKSTKVTTTTCKLVENRMINKKIIFEGGISMIYVSKIDEKEIIFISNGLGKLKIYNNECSEEITDSSFDMKIFQEFKYHIRRIIKLKNRIFLISSLQTIKILSFIKDNLSGKYLIYKIKNFLINSPSLNIIDIKQLQNQNIIVLYNHSFIQLYYFEEKKERENLLLDNYTKEIKINLNNLIDNYDMIEINKKTIAYINKEYLAFFRLESKQIITKYDIKLPKYTDDILRKISDDIICVGAINNLYFISIKFGTLIKKIIINDNHRMVAIGDLNDNNMIIATLNPIENDYLSNIFLIQIHYFFEQNNKNEFKVEINSILKFEDKGLGNIFIKELENKKITMSTLNYFYILN